MSQPSVTARLGGGTPSQHMTGRGPGGPGGEPLGPPEPGDSIRGRQGHAKPRDYIDSFMERPLWSSMVNSTQSRDLVLKLLCYVPVTCPLLLRHRTESSEDPLIIHPD